MVNSNELMVTHINDLTVGNLAFAGDWHQNMNYAQKALHWCYKNNVDTIVHTGDFGFWHSAKGNMAMLQLEPLLEKYGVMLLTVDGNHENHDWLDEQFTAQDGTKKLTPHLWYLPRALTWEWSHDGGSVSFMALGGAHSMDRNWWNYYNKKHNFPHGWFFDQETISGQDVEKALSYPGVVDVMVTHDAPIESNLEKEKAPWHLPSDVQKSNKNMSRVSTVMNHVEPLTLFHGHFHKRYTTVVTSVSGNETVVHGLNKDKSPFVENMFVVNIGVLKVHKEKL